MTQKIAEIAAWYKKQGAPADQSALVSLLREVQDECGGRISLAALEASAQALGVKASYLNAVIRRIPSLRLSEVHELEVCAGLNCGRAAKLAAFAEQLASAHIRVKFVPCMRQCGKGPNIRWDGVLHNRADEELLRKLTERK